MKSVYLRLPAAVLFLVWAVLHMIYGVGIVSIPQLRVVSGFFIADAVLAIIAAVLVLLNVVVMFIPILVYSWFNYLLLTESRAFPAPVLGYAIPIIDPTVIAVMILDVVIIMLVTALCVVGRRGY
jgi:hypothetical protein